MKQKVDGKVVEGRSYEPKEWGKLTENQWQVVKDLRSKSRSKRRNHQTEGHKNN